MSKQTITLEEKDIETILDALLVYSQLQKGLSGHNATLGFEDAASEHFSKRIWAEAVTNRIKAQQ